MSTQAELLSALNKKAGFEAVSVDSTDPNRLRIMGRVPEDAIGMNMNNWKILMYRLYLAMEQRPWKADFSKSYFIRPDTEKLVFAWRIIFQGENIVSHFKDIISLVVTSPNSARADVTEMVLPGASRDRHSTHGGRRGAGPSGSIAVGAAAAIQKQRGG